jgi:hypothetical protein
MNMTTDNNVRQFLSSNGDGSGIVNGIGDYRGDDKLILYIQPPPDKNYNINLMLGYVKDEKLKFDVDKYGKDLVLVNGITVQTTDATGMMHDLTGGQPVMTNPQWSSHCYYTTMDYGVLVFLWLFEQLNRPLLLEGANGDCLEVVLNDNFIGLDHQTFKVEGYIL